MSAVRRRLVAAAVGAAALGIVAVFLGRDREGPPEDPPPAPDARAGAEAALAATAEYWSGAMRALGGEYRGPAPVIFEGRIDVGCGLAEAVAGLYYCAAEQRLYVDAGFLADLEARAGALARDYVVAHGVGHHVQGTLGETRRVRGLAERVGPIEAAQHALRLELQADCYAGLAAIRAGSAPAPAEIESALGAVAALGAELRERHPAAPDAFTHGSPEQRLRWFRRGIEAGTLEGCDTFAVADP